MTQHADRKSGLVRFYGYIDREEVTEDLTFIKEDFTPKISLSQNVEQEGRLRVVTHLCVRTLSTNLVAVHRKEEGRKNIQFFQPHAESFEPPLNGFEYVHLALAGFLKKNMPNEVLAEMPKSKLQCLGAIFNLDANIAHIFFALYLPIIKEQIVGFEKIENAIANQELLDSDDMVYVNVGVLKEVTTDAI